MSTVTVRIPDDLRAQLDELSQRLQRPTSELIRESLRRYVIAEQLAAIRGATAPLAEARGFLSDEDVFREIS